MCFRTRKRRPNSTETYFCKLGKVFFFIKVGLGQEFDGIITTILCPGAHRCGVIELKATTQVDIIVFRGRGVEEDFPNEIDDGITTRPQLTYNLEFPSRFCNGGLLGRPSRDETKSFAEKWNALANNITGGEDILYVRGDG
jgi:hypothetical protein